MIAPIPVERCTNLLERAYQGLVLGSWFDGRIVWNGYHRYQPDHEEDGNQFNDYAGCTFHNRSDIGCTPCMLKL